MRLFYYFEIIKSLSFMKKITLLFIILISSSIYLFSQISEGGIPPSFENSVQLNSSKNISLPAIDMNLVEHEDMEMGKEVYRIAKSIPVNINVLESGTWTKLNDGNSICRLTLSSYNALALGVYYNDFYLPDGSKLFLYNADHSQVIGAFSSNNNPSDGYFATELIQGESVTLEYWQSGDKSSNARISIYEIAYVYRGYNDYFHKDANDFGDSDYCEVNVNCSPEGNNWQDEKKGVARILLKEGNNYFWCTGSLVNNVRQDFEPYFLTADHCGHNASTSDYNQWIFYFNFESSSCSNPTNSPSSNTMTGCTKVASGGNQGSSGSDFKLLLFNSYIPQSYNVYFNGWNRNNVASSSGVGIHHPSGDIKKISTYTSTLTTSSWNGSGYNSHWQVYWANTSNGHGVTEGGSSGSPIFNSNGSLIGTLTGGSSYCSSPNSPDFYGKFSYHWQSNGSAASQHLKEWLDPDNVGTTILSGTYQVVSFTGLDADYCINDVAVSLTGIPSGGTFSGTGITGNNFDPSLAGQGTFTISYTTTNGSATQQVTVHALPVVNLGQDIQLTQGQSTTIDAGAGFSNYSWSTGAGTQTISVSSAGIYSVTVTGSGGCTGSDEIEVTITVPGVGPGWSFLNTGSNHTILIQNTIPIEIDGSAIEIGDYIGVFYDSLGTLACAGYLEWAGNTDALTAWGAQSGSVDGFASGEVLKWKIWDASEDIEYNATATYDSTNFPNTGNWQANGMSGISSLLTQSSSPNWFYTNTGSNHSILIQSTTPIDIDGNSIEIGDFIGVFYDSLGTLACAGYLEWDGNNNAITAWGAQSGSVDGFASGESFKWKIWDASEDTVYSLAATYLQGFPNEGFYEANGMSGLASLTTVMTQTQTIVIGQGWSIFSTYIEPAEPAIDSVLSSIMNSVIIVKSGSGLVFWPPFVNMIGDIEIGQGYQISLQQTQTLQIEGNAVVPENTPINVPTGWSIIGYLRQSQGDLVQMINTLGNSVIIVKNGAGLVYWPPFVNMIGDMVPGEGYQINLSTSGVLTYPAN